MSASKLEVLFKLYGNTHPKSMIKAYYDYIEENPDYVHDGGCFEDWVGGECE
ncbi:hypothetical protein [Desulfovibrio gilichinskyi]|uniref:Uncharacterized protein n=1 Tax=Desulfovibrio gilichinskyi TaxID=1519643 RepID=A0A1X7C3T2_9BACT|nr:hypothetical protein [Desulfovibrio gilichinskyi]SME89324.1 hypothetical protein SAMN06295933_0273 [Desulfovibrio gilichinskyi]